MSSVEGNQQKFRVKIDDNSDFKIMVDGSGIVEVAPVAPAKQIPQIHSRKLTKKPIKRRKSFIPTGLSKEEIKKIRRTVAAQQISEYVRIVNPDDKTVREKTFLSFIRFRMRKKHPDAYLEWIKKKGIMIPCGEGKLKFTLEF